MALPIPMHCIPLTDATVHEFYDFLFAPWVKGLGIFPAPCGERRLPCVGHRIALRQGLRICRSACDVCVIRRTRGPCQPGIRVLNVTLEPGKMALNSIRFYFQEQSP